MNKYLILNFSKKVGHTNTRTQHPEKTVRGNVILTVSEDFIDRFNVPIFVDKITPLVKVQRTFRTLKSGKVVERPEHYKQARQRKGERLVEIKKRKIGTISLTNNFLFERNYLRFPQFFNFWMIDNSLFQILSNAPDFERLTFSVNGGKNCEIIGEQTDYGKVTLSRTLIEGESPHHRIWGEVVFLSHPRTRDLI